MFSSHSIRTISIFNQARGLSSCGVVNSSKVITLPHAYRVLNIKKGSKKKPKKKHIVVKRVPDDIEAIWLENLNGSNLKLFRKTSFGSFRKITNMDIFLEKLKQIYPTTFGQVHSIEEGSDKENCPPVKSKKETVESSKEDSVKGSLRLSEYLIKNIMEFPLLRSDDCSTFCKHAQQEVEEYGAVDAVLFPSVTGILNETMSYTARIRLKQWKERMIAELGAEGFQKYQEDLLTQGSKFHSTLKSYMELPDKSLVKIDPQIEGCWKSLEKLLPDITDVQFVEESVHHPVLLYKGIVDCVAAYRGTPCVIEWKKSSKPKPDLQATYDAPLQLCAYLGALPWHKNVTVENGLVVVAYTDGTPANVFQLSPDSCQTYWSEWLRRVQSYWLRKSSTIVQEEAKM